MAPPSSSGANLTAPMASIGVPAEIKRDEQRVALTPDGVADLVNQGMEVRIQAGAGLGAGFSDAAFAAAGARLVSAAEAWGAHLVVKGRRRDTAWFSIIAEEWPAQRDAIAGWLDAGNFGPDGSPRHSLQTIRDGWR